MRSDQDRVRTICLTNGIEFEEIELRTRIKDKPNGKWKIVIKDMLGFYPSGTEFYFDKSGCGMGCKIPSERVEREEEKSNGNDEIVSSV